MHLDFAAALHSRRFWLSIVSAVLLIAGRGLGIITAADSAAVYGAAGIVVSLVLGDSYAQAKHAQAAATTAASTAPAASTSTPTAAK